MKRILLTSKKWLLHREGRQSRRHSIKRKSDFLFDKPRSYYSASSHLFTTCPKQ